MTGDNSICSMLDEQPVISAPITLSRHVSLDTDECCENDAVAGDRCSELKGQWNNLALANLDFKYVPSQLIDLTTKPCPRVGDVCVRLLPVISRSDEFSSIVDLYNTYVAKGSCLMAKMCIGAYTGMEDLYIPAIPIQHLVSEWNKSLQRFRAHIARDESDVAQTQRKRRLTVVSNVTELALKNVPILSEHLWFVLHCIVSKPSLVKQVIQVVGSVATRSSPVYHTGEVDNVTVERDNNAGHQAKLYLIAKSVPATVRDDTALGEEAGATLGLIWVADEDELHDHLRNVANAYYLHVGTEAGGTFRCKGFCDWRYYNSEVFARMVEIGHNAVSKFQCSTLAGNTGDSARLLSTSVS